jgi:hypothetical protein
MCDMGELFYMFTCKRRSGQNPCPRFSSRSFPKFRIISGTRQLLMLVPNEHNIGTGRAQNWYRMS